MKTSARNAIRGSIINIVSDTLSAEVEVFGFAGNDNVFACHARQHGRARTMLGPVGDFTDQGAIRSYRYR